MNKCNIHLGTRVNDYQEISSDCNYVVVVRTDDIDSVKDYVLGLVGQIGSNGQKRVVTTCDDCVGTNIRSNTTSTDAYTSKLGRLVVRTTHDSCVEEAMIQSGYLSQSPIDEPKMLVIDDGTAILQTNLAVHTKHELFFNDKRCLVLVVTPSGIVDDGSNDMLSQVDAKAIFRMDIDQAKPLCEALHLPDDAVNEIASLSDNEILVCVDGEYHRCVRPDTGA